MVPCFFLFRQKDREQNKIEKRRENREEKAEKRKHGKSQGLGKGGEKIHGRISTPLTVYNNHS